MFVTKQITADGSIKNKGHHVKIRLTEKENFEPSNVIPQKLLFIYLSEHRFLKQLISFDLVSCTFNTPVESQAYILVTDDFRV